MTSEILLWSHIAPKDASLLTPMSNAETDTRHTAVKTTPYNSSAIVHPVNRRDMIRADTAMVTDIERSVFRSQVAFIVEYGFCFGGLYVISEKASGENAIRPVDVKDNKFCNMVQGIFYGDESGRDGPWCWEAGLRNGV
jgi:hypothetical protein